MLGDWEKIPTIKALLSFPQKMKSKLAGQWAETSKEFTCGSQKVVGQALLGGWWWQSVPWQSLPGMTCCLVLQLPTAFSPWASGTGLYFVQIFGIYKERLQHKGLMLKPEKWWLLQGALHTSAIRVGCPMALFPPRLPDPLGCISSSWGLQHPVGWV